MDIWKNSGLRTVCAMVVALGILSACGGGGGDPGANPATSSMTINATENGDTDGTTLNLLGDRFLIGDDAANIDYRGLLRFPLATVPAGANVVGAFLHISFLNRNGTPAGNGINNLGRMQFQRISGAAPLAAGDYALPALGHDPANDLVVDLPNLRPRLGLLQPVLSALAASETHLKLRMQFQAFTNFNSVADNMEFASIAHATQVEAVLEIVTVP